MNVTDPSKAPAENPFEDHPELGALIPTYLIEPTMSIVDVESRDAARLHELAWHFESGRKGETWFSAQLFALMMKSDGLNLARLAEGFPEEVAFLNLWRSHPRGEAWLMRLYNRTMPGWDDEESSS